MEKFSIVDIGGSKGEISHLLKELRQQNLIVGTEKDAGGDTLYLTNNLVAVKKVMADYDGLMLDVVKSR